MVSFFATTPNPALWRAFCPPPAFAAAKAGVALRQFSFGGWGSE